MRYWLRLLQADILPQKLSRRSAMVMLPGVSGVACTSTGTFRPARRSVSAMARSSPKLGSVTMMPSISSRCFLKRSAHAGASARDSTAPCVGSSASARRSLRSRPFRAPRSSPRGRSCARWSGEEAAVADDESEGHLLVRSRYYLSGRRTANASRTAPMHDQQRAPPDGGVQIRHDTGRSAAWINSSDAGPKIRTP